MPDALIKILSLNPPLIYLNLRKPEAQIKAVAALNEITILIANLFEMLPSITSLGVDAFRNNNEKVAAGYNNSTSDYNNDNNNKSWFCANCNGRHKDEFGFHCPEWMVGLPEESQPGYFGVIKEDDDPNRKF